MYDYKETMDRLIGKEVAESRVKGASALVIHRDKEIYYNAFGYADAERGILMERDTIIRLFSMTKPITAAAAMILMERGDLDLWDPVSDYLPAFKKPKVWSEEKQCEIPAERELTVWDLLNMTSGITYPDPAHEPGRRMEKVLRGLLDRRERGETADTQEYARQIATVPLCFQPGEQWMYGYSADILGAVIEAASGKRFGQFLQEELFDPLGMTDTGFFVPEEKRGRFAQYYDQTDEGGLAVHQGSHLGEYYAEDVAFESGGAGLVSTLDDYRRFASMLVHKGVYEGRHILGRKTVEFMAQNHLNPRQRESLVWDSVKGYGYGCLMRVLMDRDTAAYNGSLGEFGWDGWTGNYVAMDFTEEMVFLYFIQRCGAGATPVVRKLKTATYGALEL
ncbi:MAG: beta-lactamase family protein [Lachnospiraceae bacterium]|nr:beta-lactamase family protein [Lachnospiraceae bacterium]MCM1238168.1 beta-lactamase family protein [Lachnospiraceae bacterium]